MVECGDLALAATTKRKPQSMNRLMLKIVFSKKKKERNGCGDDEIKKCFKVCNVGLVQFTSIIATKKFFAVVVVMFLFFYFFLSLERVRFSASSFIRFTSIYKENNKR